jgi:PAS domain S-box-containing protein
MKLSALVRGMNRLQASRATGFVAATICTAALIGWWSGLPTLSPSWGSDFATTKPTTALCVAALGLALVHPGKNSRLAFAVGLTVIAIAAVDLLDQFGIDLGINHLNGWLVPRAAVPGPETSFRMINGVPVALALAGGSLALSRFERYHFATTALGVLVGVMQVFALLAYPSDGHRFYSSVWMPTPLTAVGLLCVAIAIVLRIGATPALRKPRPLWHLLIMLGCAIIAPLLLFGLYTGIRITDAQLRQVRHELMSQARILSAGVDREIVSEIARLQALAASPSLHQGDFTEFQRQAEVSLALQQRGNIVLIDRNMQQLVNTFVRVGKPLPKAVVPKVVQTTFETGKPQVTGLFIAPLVNHFLYGITVPVEIHGESRYVLGRSQDQQAIARLVAANELVPGRLAVVADAAHHIIARSEREDAFIGKELPPAQWHRAGPGGVFEFTDPEGQSSLEASTTSELTGWETAVWAPTALLEAPVRELWWTIGSTALTASALVVTLASWLGRLIAHSVGHAARAATTWGKGGPLPSGATPVAEVDTLMAQLRGAAARRQATEDLLRESERQLRLVTDNVPVGIVHCDAELRYKFINKYHAEQLADLLGFIPKKVIGKRAPEVIGDRLFPIIESYARACLAGKAIEFDLEVPSRTGEPRFTHCRFEPEWRDGKVVGLVSAGTDITSLKRAEAALRESEATFRAMFEVSSVGKIEVDPESGRFLRANAAMCNFVGYTEEELLARTVFDITHPDDRDYAYELLRRMIAGESAVSDLEKRCIRKDGHIVWARVTANVVRDGSGRPLRNIAVILDVTEHKEREEKVHLLMREVNHRAKNMLSVVDAIAHQTAIRNQENFIDRFSERIQALSANQDLLVRNEWNGVGIEDLVRAQLAHFADLIGSRIGVRGPKLRFTAASAQAIGLALHELATNAGKYGALFADKGRVDISWGIVGDTFTISWTEREGPPLSAPKRRGFGTIVMETMAERSVDGKVDLEYAPSGLTWRLTCPAANALEPLRT